jgi:hypothetical protein
MHASGITDQQSISKQVANFFAGRNRFAGGERINAAAKRFAFQKDAKNF